MVKRASSRGGSASGAGAHLAAVAIAACALACGGPKGGAVPAALRNEPVVFRFESLDRQPIDSVHAAGRPSVLVFVTTWDVSCQAQAGFVKAMFDRDLANGSLPVNYFLVAVQPKTERELVEQYREVLGVRFPVALVEPNELAQNSAFAEVRSVPTVIVLDSSGARTFERAGVTRPEELREALARLAR